MHLASRLRGKFPRLALTEDFSFARHTTIGCGGSAEAAAMPACLEEAAQLLTFLERERIPYCYLGAGANVLPAEGRFEGVVVRFCNMNALYADGTSLYAGAGVTAVYAAVLSREAEEALKQHGIQIEADTLVPRIVNRTGDGLCPMETSVLGISDPAEARKAIERRLAELTAQKE